MNKDLLAEKLAGFNLEPSVLAKEKEELEAALEAGEGTVEVDGKQYQVKDDGAARTVQQVNR